MLVKHTSGQVISIVSIVLNFFLFILKLIAGISTHSYAIIADGWHTLSDSLSSIFVYIGLKISDKPPDQEHPYGHGRAELIASLMVGTLLLATAINLCIEGIQQLLKGVQVSYNILAVSVTLFSILLKEILAQISFLIGKRTNSEAVRADGWHHRADALSSLMILIAIAIEKWIWWVDYVCVVVISLMIFHAAYNILHRSINKLIGCAIDSELKNDIILMAYHIFGHNVRIHHFHLHGYGQHQELTFHLYMPPDMALQKVHEQITELEKVIKHKLKIHATIHVDPEPVIKSQH